MALKRVNNIYCVVLKREEKKERNEIAMILSLFKYVIIFILKHPQEKLSFK